jgi:hypothetical protein
MKNNETPSIPINKCKLDDGSHSKYSKNWNFGVELSKSINKNTEYTKELTEILKATNFISLILIFGINTMQKIPITGIKMIHDNIAANIIFL